MCSDWLLKNEVSPMAASLVCIFIFICQIMQWDIYRLLPQSYLGLRHNNVFSQQESQGIIQPVYMSSSYVIIRQSSVTLKSLEWWVVFQKNVFCLSIYFLATLVPWDKGWQYWSVRPPLAGSQKDKSSLMIPTFPQAPFWGWLFLF